MPSRKYFRDFSISICLDSFFFSFRKKTLIFFPTTIVTRQFFFNGIIIRILSEWREGRERSRKSDQVRATESEQMNKKTKE